MIEIPATSAPPNPPDWLRNAQALKSQLSDELGANVTILIIANGMDTERIIQIAESLNADVRPPMILGTPVTHLEETYDIGVSIRLTGRFQ